MARIRSVHPGLWTDERFASVSPLARLLFIGIWNECDDMGSFEWSPLKLKMRLLPADNADAGALLEELAAANCIMQYEIDGRQLGAVRNFALFQRPKSRTRYTLRHQRFGSIAHIKVMQFHRSSPPVGKFLRRWRMEEVIVVPFLTKRRALPEFQTRQRSCSTPVWRC